MRTGINIMKLLKPAENQPTEIYTFINRRNLMKLLCLAGISMSLIISACDFSNVKAQTETNSKKENNMESIQSATTIQNNTPPIDAVPAIATTPTSILRSLRGANPFPTSSPSVVPSALGDNGNASCRGHICFSRAKLHSNR